MSGPFLTESDNFDSGVYQLQTTDDAIGGPNGIMNAPPTSLANRTRFMLNRILDGVLNFIGDSGAKNAITLVYPQPVPALKDGMEINFRVAVTNDGAVNVSLTNTGGNPLPTLPLYGGDHAALAGGELPVGAGVRARLNTALNVANGGAWVIMAVSGGYARVPTAPTGDMSTKVANMAALFQAFNGLKTVDVSAAGDTSLTAAQYGVGMLKLTGALPASKNLLFPAQTGQWIIDNEATGNYNITAAVTGGVGAGVVLPVGSPVIVQSDGTNIKFASAGGQAGFRAIPVSGVAGASYTVTGGYTPGALMIEKNGAMLEPGTAASPDFTATDGKTINFTQALVAADTLTIYLFSTFNVANAVQKSGDTMGGPLALYAGSTVSSPPANDNSQNIPSTAWVLTAVATAVASAVGPALAPGRLSWFATMSAPSGYLAAVGGTVSRATYANLFNAITAQFTGSVTQGSASIGGITSTASMWVGMPISGPGIPAASTVLTVAANSITISANATATTANASLVVAPFGVGDGSTTFGIPDLRGVFPRGWDGGAGIDPGRVFGSYQADMLASHGHMIPNQTWDTYSGTSGMNGSGSSGTVNDRGTSSTGGAETRPKNVALLPCIKY